MNNFVKCLIAGGIIIAIGIVVLIIGLSLNGWSTNPEFTENNWTQEDGEIDSLRIELDAGHIETEYYDGDKIEVEYYTADFYKVSVRQSGNRLTIETDLKWWFGWFGINNKIPQITVRLPAGAVYDMSVHMSAGIVKLAGGTFSELETNISAGTLSFKDSVECANATFKLSAGTLNAGKIITNSFGLNMSAGSTDFNEIVCSSFDLRLSAGSASVNKITCPQMKVKLSAGSAHLNVEGKKNEYNINVNKSAGSCNVQNQTGTDSSKSLDVHLSAGSVNVSFSN